MREFVRPVTAALSIACLAAAMVSVSTGSALAQVVRAQIAKLDSAGSREAVAKLVIMLSCKAGQGNDLPKVQQVYKAGSGGSVKPISD